LKFAGNVADQFASGLRTILEQTFGDAGTSARLVRLLERNEQRLDFYALAIEFPGGDLRRC